MKKILLSTLLAITLVSAEDVNTIKINDGTKPKIDLMAEIMKLDAREKILDKEISTLDTEIKEEKRETASLIELNEKLDELTNVLLTKQKK